MKEYKNKGVIDYQLVWLAKLPNGWKNNNLFKSTTKPTPTPGNSGGYSCKIYADSDKKVVAFEYFTNMDDFSEVFSKCESVMNDSGNVELDIVKLNKLPNNWEDFNLF